MPVGFDATSNGTVFAGTTITFSHTCAGTDLVLSVGASNSSPGTAVTGITYNGAALTQDGEQTEGGGNRVEIWSLENPATGTHDVVVTYAGVVIAIAGAVSFDSADVTENFNSASGSSTTPSVDITSATGRFVFDAVSVATGSGSATPGSGQTERWDLHDSGPNHHGFGSTEPGAATVTMDWTITSNGWAIAGVSITEAVVAGAIMNQMQFGNVGADLYNGALI